VECEEKSIAALAAIRIRIEIEFPAFEGIKITKCKI